jgi:hypothetical protein
MFENIAKFYFGYFGTLESNLQSFPLKRYDFRSLLMKPPGVDCIKGV